ncbi:MAG: hypothetical protein NC339_08925 [Muribaculaceae bacterium]|nr:hypothetical protein [Muribaculaceae bacterium]
MVEQAAEEDYPVRALEMLDSLENTDIPHTSANEALTALLRAELTLRNRLPLESDSLLTLAINHYTATRDSSRLVRAWHYKGRYYMSQGDLRESMKCAIYANHIATSISDTLIMARTNELMAQISHEVFDTTNEIDYIKKANLLYSRTNKKLNYKLSFVSLATALASDGKSDKAIALLDSVEYLFTNESQAVKSVYKSSKYYPLLQLEKFDILDSLLSDENLINPEIEHIRAILSLRNNDIEGAKLWYDSLKCHSTWVVDTINYLELESEILKSKRLFKEALYKHYETDVIQNRIVKSQLSKPISLAFADYYSFKAQENQNTAKIFKRKSEYYAIITISIILCAISLYILLYLKRVKKLSNQIAELSFASENGKIEMSKISKSLNLLLKEHFKSFERINELIKINKNTTNQDSKLFKDIVKEFKYLSSTRSKSKIIDAVDKVSNGKISLFQSHFPNAHPGDSILLALRYLDLKPEIICIFLDVELSGYYSRRFRLIKKLEASEVSEIKKLSKMLK